MKNLWIKWTNKLWSLAPCYAVTISGKTGGKNMTLHVNAFSYSKAAKKVRKHFRDDYIVKVELIS